MRRQLRHRNVVTSEPQIAFRALPALSLAGRWKGVQLASALAQVALERLRALLEEGSPVEK